MRLTPSQQACIRAAVNDYFGQQARIIVFGSRIDENRCGGDLDLLLELPARASLTSEIKLSARLEDALGVPVDIVTTFPEQACRPIVEIARTTGERL